MKNKNDKSTEDRLIDLLKDNDDKKIQEFLLRNGKKKSYSPIYIKKDNLQRS